ncbi:MAG: hypothetical protein ACQEXJ_03010 [Myxococcota bacterium]
MARTATPHDDERTREAVGMAVMLLASVASAAVMAVLLRGFHLSFYVPILMPGLIGWGVGLTVAAARVHFRVAPPGPSVAIVVFGALLAYAGYHLLVYMQIVDFLAEKLPSLADRAASDPYRELQAWFEEETGREGFLAYLAFVSEGRGAGLSPLGPLFGKMEPGVAATLITMAIDAVAASGAAVGMMFLRSRGRGLERRVAAPTPGGPRVREIIARTDEETLAAAMQAMESGDYESAGRILRKPTAEDRYALAMVYNPYSADAYTLEIIELTDDTHGPTRARRELSSWDGQALWDELRLRPPGGPGPGPQP